MPFGIMNHSTVVTNENKLMILGGTHIFDLKEDSKWIRSRKCFVLHGTKWIYHSMLLEPRNRSISICMPNGIYLFGGFGESLINENLTSSEFLATGTSNWRKGPTVPLGAGFLDRGQGVAISETEIVFMGGFVTTDKQKAETPDRILVRGYASKQIWKFNIITEEWQLIGDLKVSRFSHQAIYLHPNVVICGGITYDARVMPRSVILKSTEIFNPHQPEFESLLVGDLNVPRGSHIMGMIKKYGNPTVIAFGGVTKNEQDEFSHLDSIEEWDPEKKKWKLLQKKLIVKRSI